MITIAALIAITTLSVLLVGMLIYQGERKP
jgi:hypothetical protein